MFLLWHFKMMALYLKVIPIINILNKISYFNIQLCESLKKRGLFCLKIETFKIRNPFGTM